LVQPVASDNATSVVAEITRYARISLPKATRPSTFHVQRRFRVQFGIAPAKNAITVHAVVEAPSTYRMGNTTALVVAARADEIANRVTRTRRG
jgi:hypothetical protein